MHGPNCGKLTSWRDHSAHAWDIIGFPRAILVLEAQMKLSEVLKGVVGTLIRGAGEGKDSNTFSQSVELGLKKATDKSSCVEFASSFINQPFSEPPGLNVQSLLDISHA